MPQGMLKLPGTIRRVHGKQGRAIWLSGQYVGLAPFEVLGLGPSLTTACICV